MTARLAGARKPMVSRPKKTKSQFADDRLEAFRRVLDEKKVKTDELAARLDHEVKLGATGTNVSQPDRRTFMIAPRRAEAGGRGDAAAATRLESRAAAATRILPARDRRGRRHRGGDRREKHTQLSFQRTGSTWLTDELALHPRRSEWNKTVPVGPGYCLQEDDASMPTLQKSSKTDYVSSSSSVVPAGASCAERKCF